MHRYVSAAHSLLPMSAQGLWCLLHRIADDSGACELGTNPARACAKLFNGRTSQAQRDMKALESGGLIARSQHEGSTTLHIVGFCDSQNTDKSAAERAKRYRASRVTSENVTRDASRDVTRDVTVQIREDQTDQNRERRAIVPLCDPMLDDAGVVVGVAPLPEGANPAVRVKPKKDPKAKRATRCPAPEDGDEAIEAWAAGWKIDTRDPEWPKFYAHHSGRGSTWLHWGMAWKKWLGNAADFALRQSPPQRKLHVVGGYDPDGPSGDLPHHPGFVPRDGDVPTPPGWMDQFEKAMSNFGKGGR